MTAEPSEPNRYYMYHQVDHSEILRPAHNVFTRARYFYGSQNKQRLFLYTLLTYRIL